MNGEPIPGASEAPTKVDSSEEQELPIETVRQEAERWTREFVDTLDNLPAYRQALAFREQVARVGRLGYDPKKEPVRFVLGGKEYSVDIEMPNGTTVDMKLLRRADVPTDKGDRQIGFWEEELRIKSAGRGRDSLSFIATFIRGVDPSKGAPLTAPTNTPTALKRANGILEDLKAGLPPKAVTTTPPQTT